MSLETVDNLPAAAAAEQTGFRLTSPTAARAQMRVTKRNGAREAVAHEFLRAPCVGLPGRGAGEFSLDAAF